ncbi:helicase-related protein, partial [Ethanoligenens sp.]|uniref:helicase-related protein n=1 Tax=Ethanoligenens sp. TaxID=2099655 RepID=UPI0039ED721C
EYVPLGQTLTLDGRELTVDAVNWDTGSVSLRDDTFAGATGFPIFRRESIGYVREQIEAQERDTLWEKTPEGEVARVTFTLGAEEKKPVPQRANFRISDDALGAGGKKAKYGYNLAAIRLLKTLEAEGRFATLEEQETLSRYVGWGGVPQAFDEQNTQWADEYAELKSLLTGEEYADARASTLNAHYTSPVVIKAMYETLARMGFHTGNILEPGCGVGNFFGLLPESMAASKLYGVEIDSITGRIARQLYPQADITIDGFERTDQPDSFFDLAVGNVPFGGFKLADRRYNKFNFQIHDYFFAKALDKVRPGGLIAFITSKGTLDKQNPDVRKYIAQRAELLGAVRLPNTAFAANAGTEVTTDILFLQRRDRMSYDEPAWVNVSKTAEGVPLNQYFLDHPDMLLGTMAFDKSMYGNDKETTCNPILGADFGEQLRKALSQVELPNRDALETVDVTEPDGEEQPADGAALSLPADPDVRNFSYTLVDDHLYFRENSKMDLVRDKSDAETQRIRGMIALRDSTRTLIGLQMDDAADSFIEQEQKNLNGLYDAYTAKYSLLSASANSHAFRTDSSYSLLASLEVVDEDGNLVRKADMFSKRTIRHAQPVTSVDTAAEALAVSIAEKACVDLGFMGSLMGGSEKIPSIVEDLRGVIFPVPVPPFQAEEGQSIPLTDRHWVTADEYLSGNVRNKLHLAREAAAADPLFAPNVPALEQVQPKDLSAAEIDVRLGATWVDTKYIDQFMFDVLQTPRHLQYGDVTTRYMDVTGVWNIKGKGLDSRDNSRVYATYGTKRRSAYYILEDSLNLKDTRIYDTVIDENGSEKRVLNEKETAIAQQKQEALKRAFAQWIWKDPERREVLCKKYNTLYNSTRPREYDGSHLKFDGMNPEISLRKHQRNAVAHQLYGRNTLLAHWVGAGKTFEMIAAGMEAKRLGLCQKSLYVVPNHLTEQWGADFLRLYPGANVLVATKKDFEPENRRKFCARIATGDYDAVVIGHSQLEKIPVSPERQARIIEQQIDEITMEIALAKADKSERFTVKQMEKSKKALETRLQKLNDVRRDNVVTFEELGVDRLFIDEADNFKNLALFTKMRNVAGVSQTEAKKSTDLYMKCRYLDEITSGRGIVFATGTPISNSMTELFTMMRYLQHDTLEEQGLSHFDSWAALYGETVSQMELKPEGTGFRMRTRFAKFHNLPELMSMWKEAADIQTAEMLNLPVPKAEYINVTTEASTQQADMVQALAKRADEVHSGTVDAHVDNMLRITSDGRKLALDQRLMNELLPDDPNSKVNACVQNVLQVWRDTADQKGAQLLFCDLSTPHYDGSFNVYDDVKNKLMEAGVPAEEIAFIHDANTEARKAELFAKVRKGQVRVLLGSTSKMGAGTNVQDRLAAIHHLDCPWRPRDLTQRDGRGIRQGNLFDSIKVFRYVTKGTFDAYNWGLVESKQKFISQVVTGKSPARSCEDVDDTALSYAEVKALATGDERIKEKMTLDIEVAKLRVYQTDFNSQHYELEDNVRLHFPRQIKESEAKISGLEQDIALYQDQKPQDPEAFSMTVLDAEFRERKAAGEAIIEACKTVDCTEQAAEIGRYCGFPISIRWDAFSKLFHLSLKNTLSYTVDVGLDASGNVIRINNALERMPQELHAAHNQLDTLHQQMETAQEELQKPFPQEAELSEKEKRLNALNALLAAESHNSHKDTERTESAAEPALRPADAEAKPCVHALLSELARKSAEAPRPERVAATPEAVR